MLKGYDQKHLKYLKNELKYIAVDLHSFFKIYGRQRINLILTVFGREENMLQWLGGLPVLK